MRPYWEKLAFAALLKEILISWSIWYFRVNVFVLPSLMTLSLMKRNHMACPTIQLLYQLARRLLDIRVSYLAFKLTKNFHLTSKYRTLHNSNCKLTKTMWVNTCYNNWINRWFAYNVTNFRTIIIVLPSIYKQQESATRYMALWWCLDYSNLYVLYR